MRAANCQSFLASDQNIIFSLRELLILQQDYLHISPHRLASDSSVLRFRVSIRDIGLDLCIRILALEPLEQVSTEHNYWDLENWQFLVV